jgi:hypothetical protein
MSKPRVIKGVFLKAGSYARNRIQESGVRIQEEPGFWLLAYPKLPGINFRPN